MNEMCQFERQEDGGLACRVCGLRAPKSSSRPVAACRPRRPIVFAEPQVPIFRKAGNFAVSAAKHVAAGAPRCTDEQVAARYEICVGCEHYDGSECRKCGCPVVRKRQWISKLSWAGESCPVGKWGPVAGIDSHPQP